MYFNLFNKYSGDYVKNYKYISLKKSTNYEIPKLMSIIEKVYESYKEECDTSKYDLAVSFKDIEIKGGY